MWFLIELDFEFYISLSVFYHFIASLFFMDDVFPGGEGSPVASIVYSLVFHPFESCSIFEADVTSVSESALE